LPKSEKLSKYTQPPINEGAVTTVPVAAKVVPVPEEVATVTVADFAPAEVGAKPSAPVVQVAPEAIARFAVQVPSGTENSVSEFAKGVALKVTAPPVAVRVSDAQVAVKPTASLPHAIVAVVAVKEPAALTMLAERLKVPALLPPLVNPNVSVPGFEAGVLFAGVKVMTPVVQLVPAARVRPAQESLDVPTEYSASEKL
jgi:hypothetical protein